MPALTLHEHLPWAATGLLPVFVFLTALIFLDSYKLVRPRAVVLSIAAGCAAAAACWFLNGALVAALDLAPRLYYRYGAPVVEEGVKALYLVYLIRTHRAGFIVDAAIHGFAVGAGFALVENLYYLQSLADASLFTWIIRGFGTAVMHGSATAIFGICSKNLYDRAPSPGVRSFLPGLGLAAALHALFNHFLLPPLLFTLILLLTFPPAVIGVFHESERHTRAWLRAGFDADQELLQVLTSDALTETRVGGFLQNLRNHFPPEVVADMFCLLQLHAELSIQAKGLLMMREAGFEVRPNREAQAKLEEVKYLKKSIGPTGLLALSPFLHTSSRDLWQLHMLDKT